MEIRYTPYTIYQNMEYFLKERKLELVSGALPFGRGAKKIPDVKGSFLNKDKFIQIIQSDQYVTIEAKDSDASSATGLIKERRYRRNISETNKKKKVRTFVIILSENSKYSTSSGELASLLERLIDLKSSQKSTESNMDIIIISEKIFRTNMTNKIETFSRDGSKEESYIDITQYPYVYFSTRILEHKLSPKYEILSREEEIDILSNLRVDKNALPKILKHDPPMVWIGAIPGDVLRVTSDSQSIGKLIEYCIVK